MRFFTVFVLVFFSVLSVRPAAAQERSVYSFDRLDLNDGLSQSSVNDIIQDQFGFIWIGTDDGLNLYDGKKFRVFRHSLKDTASIGDNRIQTVFEDSRGQIWVGTWGGGISVFDRKSGKFRTFRYRESHPEGLPDDYILALTEGTDGFLRIGTLSKKLGKFNPEKNTFQGITFSLDTLTVGSRPFRKIQARSDGKIRIASTVLSVLDEKTGKKSILETIWPERLTNSDSREAYDFLELPNGKILIASSYVGLSEYDPATKICRALPFAGKEPVQVLSICRDNIGTVWLGTSKGLYHYRQDSVRLFSYPHPEAAELEQVRISKVFADRSGMIWAGTQSGIFHVFRNNKQFVNLRNKPEAAPQTLLAESVSCTLGDSYGNIWIGTGAGLSRYNEQTGLYDHFKPEERPGTTFRGTSIVSLYEGKDKKLYVGTRNGLMYFDRQSEKLRPFSQNDSLLAISDKSTVFAILEDSKKRIWFSAGKGLICFDPKTEKLDYYDHNPADPTSLPHFTVRSIYQDRQGRIWVGCTESGMALLLPNGKFKVYRHENGNPKSLSSGTVRCIMQDSKRRFWVTTYAGGINLFDPKTGEFEPFSEEDGLCNNAVYGLLEDASGRLWMSTNRGLSRFSPDKRFFRNYFEEDGIQSNEFNGNAYGRTKDGRMLFGGVKGLTVFHPDSVRDSDYSPPPVINRIRVFGKDSDYGRDISGETSLEISDADNILTIGFAGTSFSRSGRNLFSYRMIGFEDERHETFRDEVTYTNLDPGVYFFAVRVANFDGVWSPERRIEIVIKPPFWKEDWFLILVIGLLGFGIFYTNRARLLVIRRQRELLKKEVEKQTAEITEKNRLAERQKAELEAQADDIRKKNKDITSSIVYAKRIQTAILPPQDLLQTIFPESFVFYRARDIVSGDFYWIKKTEKTVFLAVADCTGHGVPGAFMSLVGHALLSRIYQAGAETPAEILDKMQSGIIEILHQKKGSNRDGMDMAVCAVNLENGDLQFAGAKSPLYYVRNGVLEEVKGNKFGIGGMSGRAKNTHTAHFVNYTEPTFFYLSSDGYSDQFGGPDNSKFKSKRFKALLAARSDRPAEEQKQLLEQEFENWKGDSRQIDDILVIGFKLNFPR